MYRGFTVFAFFAFACSQMIAGEPAFNADQLVQTAEKVAARLEKEPASWVITVSGDQGGSAILEITQCGKEKRVSLSIAAQRQKIPVLTIIDHDGLWYVDERNGIFGIYRPYEAPFKFSVAYQFLFNSELKHVTRENLAGLGTLSNEQDTLLEFAAPLPPDMVKMIEDQLKLFEDMKKKSPKITDNPKTAEIEIKLRATLKSKINTRVDATSGLLVDYGSDKRRITVSNFKFLSAPDASAFDIKGRTWDDHSKVLTPEELTDTIMINNCALWTPENNIEFPPDIRLLNLKTQELRRVPIRALDSGSGCFLSDRTKVVISAVLGRPAGLRLVEVDLLTGANRLLGNSFPEGALLLGATASHDGKKLAVARFENGNSLLASQIYLLDLQSDTATPLGDPADVAFLNWLPDDQGLYLVKRKSVELDKPSVGTICKLDLNGKFTEICPGQTPLLLADGKSMLVEDTNRAWHRCDLQGKNLKDLTDGSQWHMIQSLCPTGDKVLAVKNARKGRGAEPVIFDPEDGSETPLTTLPGLWTQPVGR